MSQSEKIQLTPLRLVDGIWEGVLSGVSGDTPPQLKILNGHEGLGAPQVSKRSDGTWLVCVAVPANRIADGMQVFVIALEDTGETLANFAVLAGDILRDDIRAEVALLRAELDMLKRAFRKQSRET